MRIKQNTHDGSALRMKIYTFFHYINIRKAFVILLITSLTGYLFPAFLQTVFCMYATLTIFFLICGAGFPLFQNIAAHIKSFTAHIAYAWFDMCCKF